jgi:2-polyprenyl-3-methyl-5-hydroxy-6-metoxy-1,4-benzoquinol methylase
LLGEKTKQIIKKFTPRIFKLTYSIFVKIFFYRKYDSTEYWKNRALKYGQTDKDNGSQQAVMFRNEHYNKLFRKKQRDIISKTLKKKHHILKVLDIGCGIGIVSKMVTDINSNINIDAVDFHEMIEYAKKINSYSNTNYISSSAQDYYQDNKLYDLVISSGCYSAIRNINSLDKALSNCAKMVGSGGLVLMIDPFHRWNFLARAKYSSRDVIFNMQLKGFELIEKSGILFWPFRILLSNSKMNNDKLEKMFHLGEDLRRLFGKHFWADYKILLFIKK